MGRNLVPNKNSCPPDLVAPKENLKQVTKTFEIFYNGRFVHNDCIPYWNVLIVVFYLRGCNNDLSEQNVFNKLMLGL